MIDIRTGDVELTVTRDGMVRIYLDGVCVVRVVRALQVVISDRRGRDIMDFRKDEDPQLPFGNVDYAADNGEIPQRPGAGGFAQPTKHDNIKS